MKQEEFDKSFFDNLAADIKRAPEEHRTFLLNFYIFLVVEAQAGKQMPESSEGIMQKMLEAKDIFLSFGKFDKLILNGFIDAKPLRTKEEEEEIKKTWALV